MYDNVPYQTQLGSCYTPGMPKTAAKPIKTRAPAKVKKLTSKTATKTRLNVSATHTAASAPAKSGGKNRRITSSDPRIVKLVEVTLNGVNSRHTKRAYKADLDDFLEWWQGSGNKPLNKAELDRYKAWMRRHGRGDSAVNRALTAVRRFLRDASDNNLLDIREAESALKVRNVTQRGQRLGRWLTLEQLQQLINAPDFTILRGCRDRMLLALLAGAGLRRGELARVTLASFQQREGRWVLADLVGKHNRTRSIPVSGFVYTAVQDWVGMSGISDKLAPLFQRVGCAHYGWGRKCKDEEESLQGPYPTLLALEQEVYRIVVRHAKAIGITLAPHDLRRTYAKLARNAGGGLEQIQLTMGHASLSTTQKYLGTDLDYKKAPSDLIELKQSVQSLIAVTS